MPKKTSPFALAYLAQARSAVAACLGPKEAAAVAATLSQAMSKETGTESLQHLAEGLSAVLLCEDTSRIESRRHNLIGAIGALSDPASMLVVSPLLKPVLKLPPPLPAQTLVDLLKQPFCVGEARRLVLGQLGRHYGRAFADQWEFVDYAQKHKLDLDLTSPPKRPKALGQR